MNDLLLVNRLLVPDDEYGLLSGEARPAENSYFLRLSASHVYETVLLVESVEKVQALRRFLDALPDQAQRLRREIRTMTIGGSDLRKTLGLSRNSSWHYPRPSDKILKTVVKRYGDAEVALDVGDKMPGIRGLFADEIMLGVLSYYRPEDEDSFGELMHELAEITWRLVHFAQYAINDYMKRHSDKLDPPWPT